MLLSLLAIVVVNLLSERLQSHANLSIILILLLSEGKGDPSVMQG